MRAQSQSGENNGNPGVAVVIAGRWYKYEKILNHFLSFGTLALAARSSFPLADDKNVCSHACSVFHSQPASQLAPHRNVPTSGLIPLLRWGRGWMNIRMGFWDDDVSEWDIGVK